jgi:hypothetical protein
VNLLARNRGIPNASRVGVVDDANLNQLGRVRAPVMVRARVDDGGGAGTLEIVAMTEDDFSTWRTLTTPSVIRLPPVNMASIPSTIDLETLSIADAETLRPVVGGKAAGFVSLTSSDVSTVDRPLALTIKAYDEHLDTANLRARLTEIINNRSFTGDAIVRRIVLGGDSAVSAAVATSFRGAHPEGTVLRDVVDAGGVTGIVRSTPIAPATLLTLTAALQDHFGRYHPSQGLRFRSSSTIEDADGFNGAGLYESHTGRLQPGDGDDSAEDAIRATWASYWGFEAFEERRLANADHESGNMAIVVHANFPDSLEVNNGVALFTILPPTLQGQGPSGYVFEVNQQAGAHSVTNPPPGSTHLPEINRVVVDVIGGVEGAPRIERDRPSTLVLSGANVLSDDVLLAMFNDARAVTEAWLAEENATVVASKRRSTLTLDFETRTVAAGWPRLASGVQRPQRLVWKQARTLEPGVTVPADVDSLPVPRDVMARAKRIERYRCVSDDVTAFATVVITDDDKTPNMHYGERPFVSFAVVEARRDVPSLGMVTGNRRSVIHTAFVVDDAAVGVVDVSVAPERQGALGLAAVAIDVDENTLAVETPTGALQTTATCDAEDLYAAPAAFLEGLLDG